MVDATSHSNRDVWGVTVPSTTEILWYCTSTLHLSAKPTPHEAVRHQRDSKRPAFILGLLFSSRGRSLAVPLPPRTKRLTLSLQVPTSNEARVWKPKSFDLFRLFLAELLHSDAPLLGFFAATTLILPPRYVYHAEIKDGGDANHKHCEDWWLRSRRATSSSSAQNVKQRRHYRHFWNASSLVLVVFVVVIGWSG